MSYLSHDGDDCGCPTCDLTNKYFEKWDEFKKRPTYATIEVGNGIGLASELNEMHEKGYDVYMNVGGTLIMRSSPPELPSARDVLKEFLRRSNETDIKNLDENINLDDINFGEVLQ